MAGGAVAARKRCEQSRLKEARRSLENVARRPRRPERSRPPGVRHRPGACCTRAIVDPSLFLKHFVPALLLCLAHVMHSSIQAFLLFKREERPRVLLVGQLSKKQVGIVTDGSAFFLPYLIILIFSGEASHHIREAGKIQKGWRKFG